MRINDKCGKEGTEDFPLLEKIWMDRNYLE